MAESTQMEAVLGLEADHRGFVSERDRDDFFRHQLAAPENAVCFDCGFANPKWTSVSFSIYLCLNCSGRHRQMGSHISFVRSVDMDRFTRDQLLRLALGGNAPFTAFLNAENLLKKPLNYNNKTVLSYPGRLDAELAKYKRTLAPGASSDPRESVDSVLNDKMSSPSQSLHPTVTFDSLDNAKNTDSLKSSVRDDVEKMNNPAADTFSDLLDLRSVSSDDAKHTVPVAETKVAEEVPHTPTQKRDKDSLDVFEEFNCSKATSDTYNFDSFSDFVNRTVDSAVKTETKDSVAPMEGLNLSQSTVTDSFKTPTMRPNPLSKPSSSRSARSKFSSKATNFDFEDFEKQNTLQSSVQSFHSADSEPVPNPVSSSPVSFQTPSPAPKSVAPVMLSPRLAKSPDSKSFPSKSLPSNVPLSGSSAAALAGSRRAASVANVQRKPDVSQFEGKSSISSDAFFGNNQPVTANQVSPNRMAFSSDDYFGRPRPEPTHPQTLEEQAMQNLNELKDNIITAINRGSVLFEKAKNWLYTNYTQY